MDTRVCHVCKNEKALTTDFFYVRKNNKDGGFRRSCIVCDCVNSKLGYIKHKNYFKEYNLKRYSNPKQRAIQLLTSYKYIDSKRGRQCDLTLEIVQAIFKKPCTYCGEENELKMGLDRFDNSLGHTVNNVLPCCSECNTTRLDHFTFDEMLVIGAAIRMVKENRRLKLFVSGPN